MNYMADVYWRDGMIKRMGWYTYQDALTFAKSIIDLVDVSSVVLVPIN